MDKSDPASPLKGVVSPLGVSRYGRTRKPKISADFCHIDDALDSEEAPIVANKSPANSPKQGDSPQKKIKASPDKKTKAKPKSESEMQRELETKAGVEVSEDIRNEGLKVLNDVFESAPIDDVLKIIRATKPTDISAGTLKKRSPQQLRTYVNKRKIVAPQSRVIESFGLPDDPIVPMYGEKLVFKPFKDLDVDQSAPENVTLVDDFIEQILKESSGEFDNKQIGSGVGDLNKNKENDGSLFKSKLPSKAQYINLNNGLLLNKKYRKADESNKKFNKEHSENNQSDESIEKIVESFADIEGNFVIDDSLNHNNNRGSNHDFQTDHTYVSSESCNLLVEKTYLKAQRNSLRKVRDDLLKTYNRQQKKVNENVEEKDQKTIYNVAVNGLVNVTKTKSFIKTDGNKKELPENHIEVGEKLKRNEVATQIKENYDKINRDNLIAKRFIKEKVTQIIGIYKNCEIKGTTNNKMVEIGEKEITETNHQTKEDIQKTEDHQQNLIESQQKSDKIYLKSLNEINLKLDNVQQENGISQNLDEIVVQTIEIHAEIKEILTSTGKPKESQEANKGFGMQETLELKDGGVETTQSAGQKKIESKLKMKYSNHLPISYKHLEDYENCTSEDDAVPLSKLRTRLKTRVSAGLKNKKAIKKNSQEIIQMLESRENNDPIENENTLKSSRKKSLEENSEMLPKKKIVIENLDEGAEKLKEEETGFADQSIKEDGKSADQKTGPPNLKKTTKDTNTEFDVSVGQLMWAKVGNFPYWPCMLVNEPESNKFIKDLNRRKICHVRFFGDKGRRAWISKKHLLPYCSVAELQKYPNVTRSDVTPSHKAGRYAVSWKTAIQEADLLKNKSLENKLAFFKNVLKLQDKERKEKRLKKAEESLKKREQQAIKEGKVENVTSRRVTRNSENGKIESLPKRKKPNRDESESESESEISLQGFPSNMEEQIALYKRNNLFKKVTKERLCQICLKLGNVLRCKGRCQGFYHAECAEKNYIKRTVNGIKEEVQIEDKSHLKIDKIDDLINNEIIMSSNEKQVEIISIKDRKRLTPTDLTLGNDIMFKNLPLFEQIDHKMNEVMQDFNDKTLYLESSTDYSSVENSPEKLKVAKKIDEISITSDKKPVTELFCKNCLENNDPLCFVCNEEVSKNNSVVRQRCSWLKCGKFYHPECLKIWPQTQWSVTTSKKHKHYSNSNEFICPMHVCHTCISDDPRSPISRCYSDKLVRCVYCPSTYHTATHCVPAGTNILSSAQIICPKHENLWHSSKKRPPPINTTWCFICSEGGTLICCETCPTSVHPECLDLKYTDEDKFICEDCETGRFPLYDEVVWVKLGSYRWWPAIILFPNEVPEKVRSRNHNPGEFVVKFFGTYDHYWISKGRVFLFQEGDNGGGGGTHKRKMEEIFKRSIEEATAVHLLKKEFKESILREAEGKSKNRPPSYVKIKVNRPVGNVRQFDGNVSNTTPCECDPKQKNPCGPDSDCLNRLLLTECDPTVCPAGDKCQNQNFEQRNYPDLVPHKTEARGWGLQSLEPLKKGQFVIEYVGEMIDEQEYQRRIKQMHELKEENYYFLTIDKDRMIDAGPKGNLARFMNHSCQPNCETQKWTVSGDTRVGLFAMDDIPANTELTFNYNLECIGKEKKICKCGAPNCSGFIGVKVKQQTEVKTKVKTKKYKKKRSPTPIIQELTEPCFVCGLEGDLRPCDNKICSNYYHSKCVGLESWPEGKWICPWHNCTICTKRTIRCCAKCLNSYCPKHSQGNVRYDRSFGFICAAHDPHKNLPPLVVNIKTEEMEVTSTTADLPDEMDLPPVDPLHVKADADEVATSTPYKTDTAKSKSLKKRKRNGRLLNVQPVNKRSRSDGDGLRKKVTGGDLSRTLRSATVNSSGDNTKYNFKA